MENPAQIPNNATETETVTFIQVCAWKQQIKIDFSHPCIFFQSIAIVT